MKKYRSVFNLFIILVNAALIICPVITTPSSAEPLFRSASDYDNVLVEEVSSANTFILTSGEKIRLIGLKAPKPPKPEKKKINKQHIIVKEKANPLIPISERALSFTQQLLEKKHVRLEFDAQRNDDDFYTVAYVFLPDEIFANAEILRQGFAHLRIVQPNTKYADRLREAYREARREKRGLQGE